MFNILNFEESLLDQLDPDALPTAILELANEHAAYPACGEKITLLKKSTFPQKDCVFISRQGD